MVLRSEKQIERNHGDRDRHTLELRRRQRLEMGKPSAHNLTVISRMLHHMLYFIFLPQGGHRDEVSYYKAFVIDSILTGKRIHLGYLMMMYMIACCESATRVLFHGRFISWVFKDASIDLSKETNFEAPNTYDTYDDQSIGLMKFEKAPNSSQIRKQRERNHGDRDRHTLELRKRQRLGRQKVKQTFKVDQILRVATKEGLSLIFPHFRQRFLHRPGVFSLSPLSLSR